LWVVSLFALALAADAADRGERWTLGKRWGDASYGTYLWHFPIQLALVMALDTLPGGRALAQHWGVLALYLALALGAGFASHRWFEKPAQKAVLAAAARLRPRPLYA
jgi:peptidoglycan/LPS O-acetylase OafA/YrhL